MKEKAPWCRNEGFFQNCIWWRKSKYFRKETGDICVKVAITKIEIRMIFKIHNVLISFEMEYLYFSCNCIFMKYSYEIFMKHSFYCNDKKRPEYLVKAHKKVINPLWGVLLRIAFHFASLPWNAAKVFSRKNNILGIWTLTYATQWFQMGKTREK